MRALTKAQLESLCDEFAIVGERANAFSNFVTEFEAEWEHHEAMSEPLGRSEIKRIREWITALDAVADMIHDTIEQPGGVDRRPRLNFRNLPQTKDGGLDIDRVYWEHDLPRTGGSKSAPGAPAEVLRGIVEVLSNHGPALVHHGLRAESRLQQAYLDFAPDNEPKRKGRPANAPRALLIRHLLGRRQSFLDAPISYAEGQPFVRFCERLLEAYGVETGDTAQLIKRALGHGRHIRKATQPHRGSSSDDDLDPYC